MARQHQRGPRRETQKHLEFTGVVRLWVGVRPRRDPRFGLGRLEPLAALYRQRAVTNYQVRLCHVGPGRDEHRDAARRLGVTHALVATHGTAG